MEKLADDRRGVARAGLPAALVGLAVLAVIALEATTPPVAIYDEGVVLASALRFASGELPWRDYDPVYGPLESILLWPAIRAVGAELLELRLLRAVLAAVLVALLFGGARRLGAGRASAWLAALAAARRATVLAQPAVTALVTAAALLDRAERGGAAERRRFLLLAGLAVGACGLFRLEFGALAALGGAGALVVTSLGARRTPGELGRRLGWFALGGAPGLAVYAALVALAGPARVLEHFEALGALVEHRTTRFPLPPPPGTPLAAQIDGFFYFGLPLVTIPIAAVALIARTARARALRTAPPSTMFAALSCCGAGVLPYALSRPDALHFFPAYALSCALAGGALGRLETRLPARAIRALGAAAVILFGLSLTLRAQTATAQRARPDVAAAALPGVRGIALEAPVSETWTRTVAAVQARLGSDEPLFVGCADHSRIHINDALLYVLCERPFATRHHCFNPGITTSVEKQRELVRELESARPRAIVLVSGLGGGAADDEPGAELLDRWIARNYAVAERFGGYAVLTPR